MTKIEIECHKGDGQNRLKSDDHITVLWYYYNNHILFKMVPLLSRGIFSSSSSSSGNNIVRYICSNEFSFTWTYNMEEDFVDVSVSAHVNNELRSTNNEKINAVHGFKVLTNQSLHFD